jgi:hypothetical protein
MTTITAHDFHLPIRNEDTLREFVRLAWGVTIPDQRVCQNHSTPWRAFCDAYFAGAPVIVWHGSRGFAGKSYLLAVLALTEAVTLGVDVNVLGGSGEQSRRVLAYEQNFWSVSSAPTHLLNGEARTETRLKNGAQITALMASQTSVRGPHPARLRLDEIDEMDLSILDAAMGQPMEQRGVKAQTVMSSTRQYADGTMTEILRRANERGWPVHEWCWRENLMPHGWLKPAQVEQKRAEVTEAMWMTEYELQEPSPESRAIQPAAVDDLFDRALGEYEGAPHEYIEAEPPTSGVRYATGADWARSRDWTIIVTYRTDVRPVRCVAWERTGRLDWPVMIEKYKQRRERYPGSGLHDATGLGDVVTSYVGERGVVMSGQTRAALLNGYIAAIEQREILYPFIRWAYAEHKFASREDVFGGGDSHHLPDSISAGALAWWSHAKMGQAVEYAEDIWR